ncbi:MAG: LytR family transcriptional regulator [Nocardioidaceae bacterium]|nr:LytR family transcriptional regulator [Nocardioidaceae bacterium]
MPHRASLLGRDYEDRDRDSSRVRFRRALALCGITIVLPGYAQYAMGNRRVGQAAMLVWFLSLCAGIATIFGFLFHREWTLTFFTREDVLNYTRIIVIVLAVIWAALFVDAWRLARPFTLKKRHGFIVTVLTLAFTAGISGSLVYASQLMGTSNQVLHDVFHAKETSAPLEGRYNILLLGGDSGTGRVGLRPDSLTVASVDAATGRTVMIGVPRNLANVPFAEGSVMDKQVPNGFNCDGCYINAVNTWAAGRPDLFPGVANPGIEATKSAVEGVTGLKINYYIIVNLAGFKSLVDAVGGVRINVTDRVPIGGIGTPITDYIEVGDQVLDGRKALWYSRSRVNALDYNRMGRQKCVLNAMVKQLSPTTVILRATQIAKSSKQLLKTDIPRKEIGMFADIALKARSAKISTVSFVPPDINTGDPDFPLILTMVSKAIAKSEAAATGAAGDKGDTAAERSRAGLNTDDLDSVCE